MRPLLAHHLMTCVGVMRPARRAPRHVLVACFSLVIAVADARAETDEADFPALAISEAPLAALLGAHGPMPSEAHADAWEPHAIRRDAEQRPTGLAPLYVSFAALQALDAHSTLRAVGNGHSEANPFMAPFAGEPGLLIGAKAAAAAMTIVLSEKMWRKHPTAAVVLMIAVNAAYAAVVAHNYRQLRR